MCDLAKKWGITQGISNGDFFNQDAFSIHPSKPEDKIWHKEAEAARDLAAAMMALIPNWLMVRGNHDSFLLRMTEMQLSHQDLIRLAGFETAFQATDYFYCIVQDKLGNKWRISHPRNTSVIGGNVPAKLAMKYKMNVVAGHGHLIGVQYDLSGTYLAIDGGVCCDPEKLLYAQQRDNIRPRMTKGAVILKESNGKIYPHHILPDTVDWRAMRRLY
jgi:hypothetical protein